MPEYLAPGVFVEEVSFRSKSIEGVPTSTTGFTGMTQFGPVCYQDVDINGPLSCEPRLITSFTEFERVYGGLEPLDIGGDERITYTAHAARAFFENGGKRLYISRVVAPNAGTGANAWGVARREIVIDDDGTMRSAIWQSRWPGKLGNAKVVVTAKRSKNLAYEHSIAKGFADDWGMQAQRVKAGAVVEVIAAGDPIPVGNEPLEPTQLRVVSIDSDGQKSFINSTGASIALNNDDIVQAIELNARVTVGIERVDEYEELQASAQQKRYIGRILQLNDPEDENAVVWLDWDESVSANPFLPALLAVGLQSNLTPRLQGGHDGSLTSPDQLAGEAADLDDPDKKATGLEALAEVEDISIVALPDSGDMGDKLVSQVAAQKLMTHAEQMRYRIAVVDGPIGSSLNEIRDFRGQFDSKYAAIYYPWIKAFDPTERFSQGTPPRQLVLPPSGFVTGIYARNDINRGVHKAPANEVVRGLTKFEININKPRQEVINPEGINALRFFEGRGHRVWGARTMSSDPEWKYVNVRRLFNFVEHSIDKGSQWAVFEPNNRHLWDNIRRTIEDFLLVLWRDGALMGAKPEEAFFVRCDRSTMTQNDLDNGRLICLIGIAPVKPAEFVIFRIGQWTGDAQ
ncbi:MAG: phage tail sheath subtilisin-like domain-containing protein [Xanthomonadales bacterium]|nr:phage tail sheath subtilisin-like domain-containing protein [Xanthomonadales bacterium]